MELVRSRSRDHSEYRRLAEESRRKAEPVTDEPSLRQSYLDVAASYDKLADTMERTFQDRRVNEP